MLTTFMFLNAAYVYSFRKYVQTFDHVIM